MHVVRCVVEYLDRRDGHGAIGPSKVAWLFCHLTVTKSSLHLYDKGSPERKSGFMDYIADSGSSPENPRLQASHAALSTSVFQPKPFDAV